jgi:hypothetical protein
MEGFSDVSLFLFLCFFFFFCLYLREKRLRRRPSLPEWTWGSSNREFGRYVFFLFLNNKN